jgi:hypothetical protein
VNPISPEQKVLIQIGFEEEELRDKVKTAGGFWLADQKAWKLPYQKVLQLDLENRIRPKK